MEVTLSKKDFMHVLTRANSVAPAKSTFPMLSNVLLETSSESVDLRATDQQLFFASNVEATVSKPGKIAVKAKDLYERVKAMPDGPVSLRLEKQGAVLVSMVSKLRYRLDVIDGNEFLTFPSLPNQVAHQLPAKLLTSLIDHVKNSVSTDTTRVSLHAAKLSWSTERIDMVSTDGHRLSEMQVELPMTAEQAPLLIPLKGLLELQKCINDVVLPSKEDNLMVTLTVSPSLLELLVGDISMMVHLVEGAFPNVDKVKQTYPHRATVLCAELLDKVRSVRLACKDEETGGGVKLTFTANHLRLFAESANRGEGTDEMAIDYQGPDVELAVQATYLMDVLTVLKEDSESIYIDVLDGLSPLQIRPVTTETLAAPHPASYLHILMPMRMQ